MVSQEIRADVIVLAADRWCPYNCGPEDDKPGFMVEVAQRIFAQAGHTVVYEVVPWRRALKYVHEGTYQGAIAATSNNTKNLQPGLVFPKNEQARMHNVFFTRTSSTWRYQGIRSLHGQFLGLVTDYGYPAIQPFIDAHKGDDQVQFVGGGFAVRTNINKLEKDRVSVVLENEAVFTHAARAMGLLAAFRPAGDDGTPDQINNLYIGFTPASINPKSLEYAQILSDGMDKLRKSGKLAAILARYEFKDWH